RHECCHPSNTQVPNVVFCRYHEFRSRISKNDWMIELEQRSQAVRRGHADQLSTARRSGERPQATRRSPLITDIREA
ncbi:MAG: hypothetical protein ACK50J_13980, partial [Planctomyces sp.]